MQKKSHPVDVHVGLRVHKLRLKRNISQSVLAKAIRVSFQQVKNIPCFFSAGKKYEDIFDMFNALA